MHVVSVQTTDERGGAEYANVDLLAELVARGVQATYLTNFPQLADGTAVPVREIDLGPKLSKRSLRTLATTWPRQAARLRAALRDVAPYDVLLLHYKKEQLLSLLLPRSLAPRIVWAEWGPLPFDLRGGPARRLYARAARRAAAVVCISQGTLESIAAAGVPREKLVVVPGLVDVASPPAGPEHRERLRGEWDVPDGAIVVACISRFQRKKRNDVVVDMLDHLDPAANVVLVMAGSGDEEPALRERAARHAGRVRFVPTPRGWVKELLAACDLQVFAPSPTEGAPRSVVLGQLAGLPVIATDPEGARDLIPAGTGAIVSPSHDPRALAAVVADYANDPERRAREGEAARAYARERYAPQRIVDAWLRALGG